MARLLQEAAKSVHRVQESQCQLCPGWTCQVCLGKANQLCDNISIKEKKQKSNCADVTREQWERLRSSSADTEVSVAGGGAPGTGAEIPVQPLVQPMVR